jgi:hypothetical protein
MLEISSSKNKTIKFQIELSGANVAELDGKLRLIIDNVEYGFPVQISSETIVAELPALNQVVKKSLKEGDEIEGRLDVVSGDTIIVPWTGKFVIRNPLKLEVKSVVGDVKEVKKPALRVKEAESSPEEPKKERVKKSKKLDSEKSKKLSSEKEEKLLENVKVTKEMVMRFIELKGTKNPKMKEVIYNRALQEAKSDDPKDVLMKVVNFYKSLRKNSEQKSFGT